MMATKRRRTTMRTASDLLLMDVTTRAIILPLSLLLLILNNTIIIPRTPSLLLSTTTSITLSSSSFFTVQFAESFCNNSPSKLHPSRYLRRRHHHPNTSKIKTTTYSTATNNKSVLFVDVVTDDGRRNNVINISQDCISNNNDVMETSSSSSSSSSLTTLTTSNNNNYAAATIVNRRDLFGNILSATTSCAAAMTVTIRPVYAYTPDPDKLQESLYFISRVQEATVQQERFITNAYKNQNTNTNTNQSSAKVLQSKLKLTLLLVEKNYKLLDQINYCSQFIQPEEKLLDSSVAGYQAVEELQNAIEYVRNEDNWNNNNNHNDNNSDGGAVTEQQYTYLISSLKECRDQLFLFLLYIEPKEKLNIARLRVENENIQNRIEFGDANDIDDGNNKNAGVYNPVLLPWK